MSTATIRFHRRKVFVVLALLLLGGILWFTCSRSSNLDRYRTQLTAQGEFFELDKLAPKRTGYEPDGDLPMLDATKILHITRTNLSLTSGALVPELTTNNQVSCHWFTPSPPTNETQRIASWLQAEAEIATHHADLAQVHLLLQNPPAEKGADYRLFLNYPKADFVLRRQLAWFLTSAVLADAHAGRSAMATTNMTSLLNFSEQNREEWFVISQATRCGIIRYALNTLHYGLEARTWDEPELAQFQTRVQSLCLLTNFHQAMVYDRAWGVSLYAFNRQGYTNTFKKLLSLPKNLASNPRLYYWSTMEAQNDEYRYLKFTQERLELLRSHIQSSAWADFPEQLHLAYKAFFPVEVDWNVYRKDWLNTSLIHEMDNLAHLIITSETLRQQTVAAIALERYRLAHHRHPETLAELTPTYLSVVPSDPMDAHPMRYRLEKDGTFTLWSVGFDGKDDGGDSTMPNPQKQTFPQDARDLVWPRIDPVDLPPKK